VASEAERRQLTVMFCDLVGSTALSEQLDPEELREVVRAYQATCTAVIERYEGHIAQYLGDGLLVYFGYPRAHEDDAQRAVRAGLGIVAGLGTLNAQLPFPLHVRIGIHTGPVVVGDIGAGTKREQLALGETPNLAARLQGLAEPDTVIISAATYRLIAGLFDCQDLGLQALKGISAPMTVYRVVGEGVARSRFDVAVGRGLTPLVGREEELGLLRRRWQQAQEQAGQAVLLSGEAGIGKSRLVQTLKERLPGIKKNQPELLAHHYTEAGLIEQAIPHWQQAGQRAIEHSANVEAISHLTKGLELLKILPDTPERTQHELTLQIALAVPLTATKSYAVPEVESAYARARELCRQLGETPQLFPVLHGLHRFHALRAEFPQSLEVAEQHLRLAQSTLDTLHLIEAHQAVGCILYWLGEFSSAREHFKLGIILYDSQQHSTLTFLYVADPGMVIRCYMARNLWHLGYPDQALKMSRGKRDRQPLP
jgi:class 3 adenylate cyclase